MDPSFSSSLVRRETSAKLIGVMTRTELASADRLFPFEREGVTIGPKRAATQKTEGNTCGSRSCTRSPFKVNSTTKVVSLNADL